MLINKIILKWGVIIAQKQGNDVLEFGYEESKVKS